MYYYLCNYLFVLLFQLDAYKRPSFSESINLSIIIIIIIIIIIQHRDISIYSIQILVYLKIYI